MALNTLKCTPDTSGLERVNVLFLDQNVPGQAVSCCT